MISLTSINTVCSSSKWLQKKQVIAKKGGTPALCASSKSAFCLQYTLDCILSLKGQKTGLCLKYITPVSKDKYKQK